MGERTAGRALSLLLAFASVLSLATAAMCTAAAFDPSAPVLALPAIGAGGLTGVLVYLANRAHDEGR